MYRSLNRIYGESKSDKWCDFEANFVGFNLDDYPCYVTISASSPRSGYEVRRCISAAEKLIMGKDVGYKVNVQASNWSKTIRYMAMMYNNRWSNKGFTVLCKCLFTLFAVFCIGSCDVDDNEIDNSTCELLSFSLLCSDNPKLTSDIVFILDENEKTYRAYCLNWTEGLVPHEGLIPTFSFDGAGLYLDGKELISGVSSIDLASDITLVVKSKSKQNQYSVSFICPQINNELPVIRLLASPDTISKDDYISAKAVVYDTNTGKYDWDENKGEVKIRGRGNSTWLLPKKPYRIKFSEKISPLGMTHTQAKDWVLLAHDMDKSLLRNHLAFSVAGALFNDNDYLGRPFKVFSPKSQFVNVFFDSTYYGIYQLTDQIEKGDGRVDIETLNVKKGDDENTIAGGHMLEMVYRVEDWSINFRTPSGIRIDHKYPKKDDYTEAQWQYIEQFVDDAENVLYGDKFKDENEGWRKYFDEQTLVDWIIVKEFVGDMDGYIGTRMFKTRQYNKTCFGPVWDMDKAWGNDNRIPFADYPPASSLMIFGGFRTPGNSTYDWFMRLWEDEKLRKAVYERWLSKRTELVDLVCNEIEQQRMRMKKSVKANYMVWPFDVQNCQDASLPQETYDKELDHIKKLALERASLLDILFNRSSSLMHLSLCQTSHVTY